MTDRLFCITSFSLLFPHSSPSNSANDGNHSSRCYPYPPPLKHQSPLHVRVAHLFSSLPIRLHRKPYSTSTSCALACNCHYSHPSLLSLISVISLIRPWISALTEGFSFSSIPLFHFQVDLAKRFTHLLWNSKYSPKKLLLALVVNTLGVLSQKRDAFEIGFSAIQDGWYSSRSKMTSSHSGCASNTWFPSIRWLCVVNVCCGQIN